MFRLSLFRIRAFAAGSAAALLVALARGGLQFMLIIWLQGIWLPLHGYAYADTPLWAGLYLLPLTAGFLVAGPLFGHLSDRYGTRLFATWRDGPGGRRRSSACWRFRWTSRTRSSPGCCCSAGSARACSRRRTRRR